MIQYEVLLEKALPNKFHRDEDPRGIVYKDQDGNTFVYSLEPDGSIKKNMINDID